MIIIMITFLLFGMIPYVSSIQCYECIESDNYCTLPLNLDGGDESNENNVASSNYDSNYACMSDHFIDLSSNLEKIILRGSSDCQELDIPNHRVYCCYTDNCNKVLPIMQTKTLADMMSLEETLRSSKQSYISSMILIVLSIVLSLFLIH